MKKRGRRLHLRSTIIPPLPIRQPVPNVATIRDLLVETALQCRLSIIQLTAYTPRRRSIAMVVRGSAAFVAVARDTLGYNLADVAAFLGRPVTSVAHLYHETGPRLMADKRYVALVSHLDLFARGVPTPRTDLSRPAPALPPHVFPKILNVADGPVSKMLRLWLMARSVQHREWTLVTVDDVHRLARDIGVTPWDVSSELAWLLDSGSLAVHSSDAHSVSYRLIEDRLLSVGSGITGRPTPRVLAMDELASQWARHKHKPGRNPREYGPIYSDAFEDIEQQQECVQDEHEPVYRVWEPGGGPGGAADQQRGERGQPACGADGAVH